MTRNGDPLVALSAQMAKLAMQLADLEGKLAGLRGDVDRLDALAAPVADLSDRVAELAAIVGKAATDPGQRADRVDPRPWAAVILDEPGPDGVRPAASALAAWLETVFLPHYSEHLPGGPHWRAGELPPCWIKHRAVANELWTLYQLWDDAYGDPEAGPRGAGDWHDRWLPGALERIAEVMQRCTHHDPTLRPTQTA